MISLGILGVHGSLHSPSSAAAAGCERPGSPGASKSDTEEKTCGTQPEPTPPLTHAAALQRLEHAQYTSLSGAGRGNPLLLRKYPRA